MRRRSAMLVLAALAWEACGKDAPASRAAARPTVSPPGPLGARIAVAVAAGRARAGCDRPAPATAPAALIAITARQCLSCLEVGAMLRDAERHARGTGADMRVAAREDEAEEVCAFVGREKVRMPVLLLPPDAMPVVDSTSAGSLLYVVLNPDASLRLVKAARSGPQLLQQIRDSLPEPGP